MTKNFQSLFELSKNKEETNTLQSNKQSTTEYLLLLNLEKKLFTVRERSTYACIIINVKKGFL